MISKIMALRVLSFVVVSASFFFTLPSTIQASVSYANYLNVMAEAHQVFSPDFNKIGEKLIFDDRWEDSGTQAYGQTVKGRYIISITGGLATNSFIDEDVLKLIICTAIGRKMGGAPYMQLGQHEKLSLPGQADYFATARCMKRWPLKNENRSNINQNKSLVGDKDYNPRVKALCKSTFQDTRDQEICLRSAHAGRDFSWALEVLNGKNPSADFDIKANAASTILDAFPDPQCRLNTFLAGALCQADLNEEISWEDAKKGFCSAEEQRLIGARPDCWYQ